MYILDKELLVIYGDNPGTMIKVLLEKIKLDRDLPPDARIGIKPNLVLAKPSASGATTDPELVRGIVEYLQEKGFKDIRIMESSWVGDKTSRAYKVCGYEKIALKYKIPLLDLKKDDTVSFKFDDLQIKVAKSILELDYLINVPVLKAHCQTKLTCALKNLKGCIPDAEKRRFHTLGLHKPIALLNKIITSNLVIVDGIIGDLTFEEGGNPVQMNRIIAGKDPVLVDSYACELLGYHQAEVNYIALAEKLGVGSGNLGKAKITEINRDDKPEKKFPATKKVQRLARRIADRNACSACYGSLIHALERLREKGLFNKLTATIAIGQGYKDNPVEGIGIGKCVNKATHHIPGCPPRARDIVQNLESHLLNKNL